MTSIILERTAAVLFDLDGTLVDSAPDLAGAVNALRISRGLDALPLAQLRPYASHGARGLIGAGLSVSPEHPEFDALRNEFLDYYQSHACVETALFDGMEHVLQTLEAHRIPWGIVTNKHERFTKPLLEQLNLSHRAAVIISGDTAEHAKPHPAPLLLAAERLGLSPEKLVYVGDDQRDIQSAKAANYQLSIAAAYGYCQADEVSLWQADFIVQQPEELLVI